MEGIDTIRDDARERIREHLEERFGVDVDDLEELEKGASHWLAMDEVSIQPPLMERITFAPLFESSDHALVDERLGLSGSDHHHDGGLADDATLDPARFAPLANTIVLAKLLLLDGPELDRALGDMLVARGVLGDASTVRTYTAAQDDAAPSNVMVDALTGTPWLRSITSDHSWRSDPLAADFFAFPHVRGGTGQFPIWESCVLRPAFRALFQDWENGMATFPDLGDVPSPDPASDPSAPAIALEIAGRQFDDGTTRFIGHDNFLRLSANDGAGFTPEHVALRYRVRAANEEPGEWATVGRDTIFAIRGPDGPYVVEVQSQDPCHTFAHEGAEEDDALPPGELHAFELVLAQIGTEGPDVLVGTNRDDVLVGLGGNDLIVGRRGNDEIHGGPGRDELRGDDGNDVVSGDDGDDRLRGGDGHDALFGGAGRDLVDGKRGADEVFGEEGDDELRGGAGNDVLDGGPGRDLLKGEHGVDACAPGDDTLRGCER